MTTLTGTPRPAGTYRVHTDTEASADALEGAAGPGREAQGHPGPWGDGLGTGGGGVAHAGH